MTVSKTPLRNPYIVGSRITNPKMFFGRESLFEFVEKELKAGQKVILLNGQRRVGKSSVLFHIPNFVAPDEFIFIEFDLQNKARWNSNKVLYHLAQTMIKELNIEPSVLKTSEEDMNIDHFDKLLQKIPKGKKIALLLDEFDILEDSDHNSDLFFDDLKSILGKNKNIFAILVIGRKLNDLPRLIEIFENPPYQQIGLLNYENAKNLIIQPAKDCLTYTEDAIHAILDLSSGHPYYTQLFCHTLFNQAREEKKSLIEKDDVINETTVNQVFQGGALALESLLEELSIEEKVMLSAIAATEESLLKSPYKLLESHGAIITSELQEALETLKIVNLVKDNAQLEFVAKEELKGYQTQVKLVSIWLNQFHSLKKMIKDLDILNHPEHSQYKILNQDMYRVRHKGRTKLYTERIEEAIQGYQAILDSYPNCFTALSDLAQLCLENEKYEQAYEAYGRLYLVSPIQYQEDYVNCSFAWIEYLENNHDTQKIHEIYSDLSKKSLLNDHLEKKYLLSLKKVGDSCRKKENYLGAIEYYSKIYEIKPQLVKEEYLDALYCATIDAVIMKNFQKIEHYHSQCCRIEPSSKTSQKLLRLSKKYEMKELQKPTQSNEEELQRLTQSNEEELQRLTQSNEEELQRLTQSNEEELQRLTQSNEEELQRLKKQHK